MRVRRLSFLPVLLPLLCLASFAQDAPERYSALNGNWHLTGGWEIPLQSPRLTLSMGVDGDKIYGKGDFQMNCPDNHSGLGMSFEAQGEIASDGSFVLNVNGPEALSDLSSARIFDSISISREGARAGCLGVVRQLYCLSGKKSKRKMRQVVRRFCGDAVCSPEWRLFRNDYVSKQWLDGQGFGKCESVPGLIFFCAWKWVYSLRTGLKRSCLLLPAGHGNGHRERILFGKNHG
jgi:hypothetical protein